ncbi:MAG TPA: replication-associated recombination protein A [Tissierellia bacterium]|nr:replication-associated recombination protein A [Tissierellia bacterium]
MNLFDILREDNLKNKQPLAERMKPNTLDEFVGQDEILGPGKLLRRLVEADRLTSIILHGPTGVGKTSLARIISNLTSSDFITINAVTAGIKDIKQVVERSKQNLEHRAQRTILFVDEIHRFNKAQQDALLPHVENGIVILIGATTENPYFEVNRALLSRSLVFELTPLSEADIIRLIDLAIATDPILSELEIELSEHGKAYIAKNSLGDARRALNILELATLTTEATDGRIVITEDTLSQSTQKPYFNYDKQGDYHYDVISAFIKSVRGSDPQAALYYMTQMLLSGEDPKFIARRLIILAAEDIGLADPQALVLANAGFDVVHKIGLPEARIVLAEVCIYLALAEKSNTAYEAIGAAYKSVKAKGQGEVPAHLRDSTNKDLRGIKQPYRYPHAYQGGYIEQQYLPDTYQAEVFYSPKRNGVEGDLVRQWMKRRRQDEADTNK